MIALHLRWQSIMLRSRTFAFAVINFFIFVFSVADQFNVVFLYPQTDRVYNYLDTVNISWTSNYTDPVLYFYCASSATGKSKVLVTVCMLLIRDWTGASAYWSFDAAQSGNALLPLNQGQNATDNCHVWFGLSDAADSYYHIRYQLPVDARDRTSPAASPCLMVEVMRTIVREDEIGREDERSG